MDESWMEPQFLDRLRVLFLRLKKRKRLRRKGMQISPSLGATKEFKDYRPYSTNDDFRSVDWRLYARLDRLFVKLYEEHQEFHVHVVLDTSASMAEPYEEKRNCGLQMATALAYLGLVGHHRVSIYTMEERSIVERLSSLQGAGSIKRVVEFLRRLEFTGGTQLRPCVRSFRPTRQRYGVIFLLSDLLGREVGAAAEALRYCSSWPGETHVIHLLHPQEKDPQVEGELQLRDVERGDEVRLWLTSFDLERYRASVAKYLQEVEVACQSRQVDYLHWDTEASFDDTFLELLDRGSVLGGDGS